MNLPIQDFLFYYLLAAGILFVLILTIAIIVILHREQKEVRREVQKEVRKETRKVRPVKKARVPSSKKKQDNTIIPELWDKSNCHPKVEAPVNPVALSFDDITEEGLDGDEAYEKAGKKKVVAIEPLDGEEKGSLLLSALIWGVAVPTAFLGVFNLMNKHSERKAIKAAQPPKKKKKKGCNGNCKCCRSKCPFGKLGCKGRFAKL